MFKTATFRTSLALFAWRLIFVSALLSVFTSAAHAQAQASCTFTNFGLAVNIPNLGPGFISPAGINDYGTIVGTATASNDQIGYQVAFIRWANGGYSFPFGTGGASNLTGRNDSGISIGNPSTMLKGTTVSMVTLNGGAGPINSLSGINAWGSIVGTYFTDFPNALTGFKRWSNGGFTSLNFPGGLPTNPTSINDNGAIVGVYSGGGFLYHNGAWATIKFPNATSTSMVGISNAGQIVGNALMPNNTSTPFLYENGTFKIISVPGAMPNSTTVFGISPKLGLILGNGFIAKCQ